MPDEPAIDVAHPPEALLRVFNPTLRVLLGTPLGAAMKDFMVVSFTGRKSGKRYAVPVSAHHLDGQLYVLLEAAWKHNFRDGAPAQVVHAGKTRTMQGQLITDPAVVADVAHRVASAYGPKKAQRSMGMKFRDGTVPSVEQFAEATKTIGLSAIKLTA